jgi:hypothetical protein
MKIKTIKKEKDLKAGRYIRAVINSYGRFFIEHVLLRGKPHTVNVEYLGITRVMPSVPGQRCYHKEIDGVYVSSLSGKFIPRTDIENTCFGTALIPFSNKVWNYLKGIKDVREFARVINRVESTDWDFMMISQQWSYRQREHQLLRDTLISGESRKKFSYNYF